MSVGSNVGGGNLLNGSGGLLATGVVSTLMNAHNEAKISKAKNKAIMKYNEKLQYESMQTVNQSNLERASAIAQNQEARFNIGLINQNDKSNITQQAAAADTIGASVQDAIASVDVNSSLDRGTLDRTFEDTMLANTLQSETATRQSINGLKDAYSDQSGKAFGQGLWSMIGAQVANIGGNALESTFKNAYNSYYGDNVKVTSDIFGKTTSTGFCSINTGSNTIAARLKRLGAY